MVRVRAGDPSKTLASVQPTKAERAERTATRGQRIKIGTRIPSLDPIIRRRRRGLSDLPRRAKPRPFPQFGTDFGVLQPFGGQRRKPVPRGIRKGGQKIFVSGRRPSRVTVTSPSERRDRLITVSSRSRLAREESVRRRDRRPDVFRTGARGKQVKVKQKRPIRVPKPPRPRPPVFDFMPFQEITFREGREGRGRRFGEEEERPRRRFQPSPRRRREQTASDFDLGNIFDVQF